MHEFVPMSVEELTRPRHLDIQDPEVRALAARLSDAATRAESLRMHHAQACAYHAVCDFALKPNLLWEASS